jgi:hypothetical protein
VDVEHPVTLIDAVDWTLVDASLVLQVNTWQGDYVGHWFSLAL